MISKRNQSPSETQSHRTAKPLLYSLYKQHRKAFFSLVRSLSTASSPCPRFQDPSSSSSLWAPAIPSLQSLPQIQSQQRSSSILGSRSMAGGGDHHHHHHWLHLWRKRSATQRKGFVGIRVGPEGEEQRRFEVPVRYLGHPLFVGLLEDSEKAYGLHHDGPISIPCDVEHFLRVKAVIECQMSSPCAAAAADLRRPRRHRSFAEIFGF